MKSLRNNQLEAYNLLKSFLKSNETDFTICGVGGTGKTTLIRQVFLKKLNNKEYIPKNVIGITVTHQARLNLSKYIPNSITYASAVNLIMDIDPDGIIYFKENNKSYLNSVLKSYKYIIVDECSMFSQSMIDILKLCSSSNAKFIWIGDFHQLPPIGVSNDEDSPTFKFKSYELKEKIRINDDEYISELCDITCEHIETNHDLNFLYDLKSKYDYKKNKGYAITNIENVITSFVRNFKKGDDVRITSYRNKRINMLNNTIRMFLWDNLAYEKYVPGEMIVMNNQYCPKDNVIAYNGQVFFVHNVSIELHNFIECYVLTVYNGNNKVDLYVPTDKGIITYRKFSDNLKMEALISNNWFDYINFKAQFADISYAYAVSNYKIQGSTIKGCYVDLSDILDTKTISNKRKLQAFYVGISRPTHYLAIF